MMLLQRKTWIDDLHAQGEIFSDLFWAFKCLETVENLAPFKCCIEDKTPEWEEGANIIVLELSKAVQTKYKNLFETGKWKLTTVTSRWWRCCHGLNQKIQFCSVGSHHQNGIVECCIRNPLDTAQVSLLHAIHHWPEGVSKNLWPFTLKHAGNTCNRVRTISHD